MFNGSNFTYYIITEKNKNKLQQNINEMSQKIYKLIKVFLYKKTIDYTVEDDNFTDFNIWKYYI